MVFTSEKLDKLDELLDAVNNLKIDDAEYYWSITATASDTQGDLTRILDIVTHTRNGNFEKKLSNQTIPVLPQVMNPNIYQWVAPIVVAPQTLLAPETREVVADVALFGVWVNRTMW